jgi:alpha-mannosidase
MYAAEAAATLGRQIADVPYPQENLEEAWRHLLFDQFHDILPGSGVRATRHYTLGHAQDAQAAAGMARTNALRALSRRVNTEALREGFVVDSDLRAYKDEIEAGVALGAGVGNATSVGGESAFSMTRTSDRAYLAFNPLAHPRIEVVRTKLWDTQLDPAHLVATGDDIDPVPVQVLGSGRYAGHEFLEIAFPVNVPALGYRAVCVSDRRVELGLPAPETPSLWDGTGGALRTRRPTEPVMENEFFAVRLDKASGAITSLLDKRSGRELVPSGEHLGVLEYCLEANEGMTAWVIGQFKERRELLEGGRLDKIHDGPHMETFRWTRALGETTLALDISLSQGVPRIDFVLRVDWREVGDKVGGTPNLRVRFPLDVDDPVARYEVPFGVVRRDLYDGQEVPAQRWVDISAAAGQGATLTNTSKYGFSVEGTTLTMTLLRASIDPDPLPDLGEHVIQYALVPHGTEWSEGDMVRSGEELNIPLVVTSTDFHEGDLPLACSFVSLSPDNVRLVAIKQAQHGDGFIARFAEVEGADTQVAVLLSDLLSGDDADATVVDTLERPLDDSTVELAEGTLQFTAPAYGVVTVLITPQGR